MSEYAGCPRSQNRDLGHPAIGLEGSGDLTAVAAAEASCSGEGVLTTTIMAGVASVAHAVAGFVGVEVIETRLTTAGQRAVVAVTRVKAVVDVAPEAVVAVEPGTGSKKYPAIEPVGSVVSIGGAVVGRVVKVAVGAYGLPLRC